MDDLVQTISLYHGTASFRGTTVVLSLSSNRPQSIFLGLPVAGVAEHEFFACRQRWGRRVAYSSQFADAVGRAHIGKDRINRRLCRAGKFDPGDWDFPPRPKWMRWATYDRAEKLFDRYEEILDFGTYALVARLMGEKAG